MSLRCFQQIKNNWYLKWKTNYTTNILVEHNYPYPLNHCKPSNPSNVDLGLQKVDLGSLYSSSFKFYRSPFSNVLGEVTISHQKQPESRDNTGDDYKQPPNL